MRFHFKEIKHVPGNKVYIVDALSRLQTRSQTVKSAIDDDEMQAHIGSVISSMPASDARLQQIMKTQEDDPVCRQIKVHCCEGWPDKYSLKDAMKLYWSSRGELSVVQNILLKASRIVISSSMRLEILDKIHQGHQGITKSRERAKILSGGHDSAEKSRIWCNNAEFALFKGTTSLNRLSRHPYLTVPGKS